MHSTHSLKVVQWFQGEDVKLSLIWSYGMDIVFRQAECQQSVPALPQWCNCRNVIGTTWGAQAEMALGSSSSLIMLPRQKKTVEVEKWHLQEQEFKIRVTWQPSWLGRQFTTCIQIHRWGWVRYLLDVPRKFTDHIPACWNTMLVLAFLFQYWW